MGTYYTLHDDTINGLKNACYRLYKIISDRNFGSAREEVSTFKKNYGEYGYMSNANLDYKYHQPLQKIYDGEDYIEKKLKTEYNQHIEFCDVIGGYIFETQHLGRIVEIDFVNETIRLTNERGSDPRKFWVRFRGYSYISLGKQFYLDTNSVPIRFEKFEDLDDEPLPTCNSTDLDELEKFLNSL